MTEPAKRPQGRPTVPPDLSLRGGSIRLTVGQWAKLERLGGADWIRRKIDFAKITVDNLQNKA